MIIKTKAPANQGFQVLKELLTLTINEKQRMLIERELKLLKAGERGEQDSAYFLDFAYGSSPNWAIIHDLRIEWKGRTAQIDHLLINRFLEIYVLETKNFFYGVKISDQGEFNIWNGKTYFGIESPVEQNKRHIAVLADRISAASITPKRLGIPIPVTYNPYVLMSPKSRIIRPSKKVFATENIIKADMLKSLLDKSFDEGPATQVLSRAAKIVSSETLEKFAQGVARFHRPALMNYRSKFGIPEKAEPRQRESSPVEEPQDKAAGICEKCGVDVEKKVVSYCRFNRKNLGGYKVLCRECQSAIRAS